MVTVRRTLLEWSAKLRLLRGRQRLGRNRQLLGDCRLRRIMNLYGHTKKVIAKEGKQVTWRSWNLHNR